MPEGGKIGAAVNEAMRDIEKHNAQVAGALPKTYEIFDSKLLKELLKKVSEIPVTIDYDAFGRIYEYFLGEFARTEGQKGGEFYTPSSIVRFLVEVLEPFHGRILDPACGSGGMFVQSARFVAEHQKNPSAELSIHGQEKVEATAHLCRMNLAVHALEGDIKKAITYPEAVFASYLVRIRARSGVSNRMLGILLESDCYKQFIKTNMGGAGNRKQTQLFSRRCT